MASRTVPDLCDPPQLVTVVVHEHHGGFVYVPGEHRGVLQVGVQVAATKFT